MQRYGHYINGSEQFNSNKQTFETKNPATGQILATLNLADSYDIQQAIDSALKGYEKWRSMSLDTRADILHAAGKLILKEHDHLAELEMKNTGKPISEAMGDDIQSAANALIYFASACRSLHGESYPLENAFAYTRREPLGIVAGVGAWNYPLQVACWKAAPALACGNAMIYKPSEFTPLTTIELAKIFTKAGLPDGVFNVILGDKTSGQHLVSHPNIAKISLTGSIATGKAIMKTASDNLKQVSMELGGKSPLIIFNDANIENAVNAAMNGNFYTQGEVCSNCTRVFVHDDCYEPFIKRLLEKTKLIKIGDPSDKQTQIGAMIHQQHAEKVLNYIQKGTDEGAKCLYGGKKIEIPELPNANFIEPTIFTDCTDDMTITKEEIFGPVMSILRFKDEAEVIKRANNTKFGLAAGIFTQDIQRAHRVIHQIQAGTCWINEYNIVPICLPFGGYKESGFGRENSLAALEYYSQRKSIYVALGDVSTSFT